MVYFSFMVALIDLIVVCPILPYCSFWTST